MEKVAASGTSGGGEILRKVARIRKGGTDGHRTEASRPSGDVREG